ncbi:alpha/beta hydrolase [Dysgonomonas sp. Marseille-P4677]|uniref:alpha/beta hydrolase n=1 Tax=Dysgonomonas sp. Marseille-P4677 TaxID=2364790 RepID=UPI00191386C6|nr:alpha/beta hydrolase [Dysgonomonas sp. Marseille-P4677]MBK5719252.1 alpha/beta hydrolase [Dysgonomonas sp. Marseille-P4677]
MGKKTSTPINYLEDKLLGTDTKEYLKVLNSGDTPVESLPPTEARKVLEEVQSSVKVKLSGIKETYKTIQSEGLSVELVIIRPKGKKKKLPVFIFLHGGGWVLGDYPTHKRLVRDLVIESGFACIFVEYTRSPEAKFPQALDEIYAATKWVAQHGSEINVDSKKLAIVGNSVGGNMAIGTCIRAKEKKGPKIKYQILLWPYSDAGINFESYKKFGDQRFLTTPLMEWMRDNYVNEKAEWDNIYVSPMRATKEQLKGLPPTLIEVAENDILRDGAETLGRNLDEAGVPVTSVRFNGVIHDWGLLNGFADIQPTKDMITFSAAMLKKHLE